MWLLRGVVSKRSLRPYKSMRRKYLGLPAWLRKSPSEAASACTVVSRAWERGAFGGGVGAGGAGLGRLDRER
jgi:hypothetical protein